MNAIALKTDFNNLPDNIIVLNKQESKLKETETKLINDGTPKAMLSVICQKKR